jgi:predicted transcriptional regulator
VLNLGDASIVSEISSELASETRCSILISLANKPAKLSSLAREISITAQEAFRNLNRLVEADLVVKGGERDESNRDSSSAFHLTEIGNLLIKEIPYLMAIRKHQELLKEHTLNDLPEKFIHRIGVLMNCETLNNVTAVFEKLKKLESKAENRLKIMVSQAWPEEGKILADRATNGVDVSAILGRNTVFPKEVMENVIPTINELEKSGKIKRKMLDTVKVGIYISESQSALMLSNMKGEVDMNVLLHGDDPSFIEWCLDLFNHYWEQAGPANLDKVKVV